MMLSVGIKNDGKYFWTEHAKFKLKQYGLSVQRIKRVIRAPKRKEEGVAKNTVAVMQPVSTRRENGKEVWKQEIWAMYQEKVKSSKLKVQSFGIEKNQLKIISVWRYPGVSPKNNPIPEEIWNELENFE
jgi:hypothetical protein